MATCPLTGAQSEKLKLCEQFDSWPVCLPCPALTPETVSEWPRLEARSFLAWAREMWAKEQEELEILTGDTSNP